MKEVPHVSCRRLTFVLLQSRGSGNQANGKPMWAGRPIRTETYGKKREHGSDPSDFGQDGLILFRYRSGSAVRCVQSWRAMHIARHDCTQQTASSCRCRTDNGRFRAGSPGTSPKQPLLPCSFTRMGLPAQQEEAERARPRVTQAQQDAARARTPSVWGGMEEAGRRARESTEAARRQAERSSEREGPSLGM